MAVISTPPIRVAAGAPEAVPAKAILVVDDIVKRFETPDGILTAVDHVSFTVKPGEFVSLIGPSGCGKSTLFNLIGGPIPRPHGTTPRPPHPRFAPPPTI